MTTLQHDTTTAANSSELQTIYLQLDPARQDQLVGACLKAMREATGMTTRVMATEVGCSRGHLGRIESGQRSLTPDVGKRISRAIASQITRVTA
jgi:DNA-binding transcriptional regulator YiaG